MRRPDGRKVDLQNGVTVRWAETGTVLIGKSVVPKLVLQDCREAVLNKAKVLKPTEPHGDLVDTDEEAPKQHRGDTVAGNRSRKPAVPGDEKLTSEGPY